jgi:hypothetical protein
MEAVRAGLGQGIDEELAPAGIQRRPRSKEPLARGGGHRDVNIESLKDVLASPHGLDATGGEPALAPRQPPETAVVLAQHSERAAVLRRKSARQALTTRGLACRHGVRLVWCGWGAAR